MKYLVIILSLLIALPSVQAGWCDMGGVQGSTEQSAGSGHDCCPSEKAKEAQTEQACKDGNHCAGCFISVAVVPLHLELIAHHHPQTQFSLPLPALVPSHSVPPYRPPIS